jgi:hypothetical protein
MPPVPEMVSSPIVFIYKHGKWHGLSEKNNTFTPLNINENRRDISKNTGSKGGDPNVIILNQ